MFTYTRGNETLEMGDDGAILVKRGDSLSKYSLFIYGDYKQLHQFKRRNAAGELIEIDNVNLIYAGETLYHVPDYERANRPSDPLPAAPPNSSPTPTPNTPVQTPGQPSSGGLMRFFGAEIIALDNYDLVGFIEGITTIDEVVFSDVPSFVDGVLNKLGSRKLSLLHVQAHGKPYGIEWGQNQWVTPGNFNTHRPDFARLCGTFHSDAWLDLRCCWIGQNLALMREFRNLWNVNVIAGTGLQNNVLDMNRGDYQVVTASGAEYTTTFSPPWVRYDLDRRFIREFISRF